MDTQFTLERNHNVVQNDLESESVYFLSYNSTGFNSQRADFLSDLCSQFGIQNCFLSVQEHWLLKGNIAKIENLMSNDLVVSSIGAFKDTVQVKRGRGIAGLSQIWHKSVDHLITKLTIPCTNRVQAVVVDLKSKVLWLNTYFPGDPGVENFDETELRETLAGVKWAIENSEYDNILWCGDINADFIRNNRFTGIVNDFINTHQLKRAWLNFSVDHTFNSPANNSTSTIDHFMFNKELFNFVETAGVIHRGDNLSGHSPIFLKLKTDKLPRTNIPTRQYLPKQCWKKATSNDKQGFKYHLKGELDNLRIPHSISACTDVNCQSLEHRNDIDQYILDIINSIEDSAQEYIPYSQPCPGKSPRKVIPGWTELVKPFCEDAKFWYSVWYSAGKPNSGELHNIMCHTRNRFKYAKRRCQNACDRIKRDKLVQAALSGDCNLFEELGKIKGRKNNHSASKIDGISGDVKIAEHFKEIYKDLYNKTGSDQPLRNLRNEVNTKCSANDMNVIDKVTPCLIDKIISNRLKPGKTDVDADITTDCLKNAPYELSCHISNFLKACLMHGYISDNLLTCAIILLVKSSQKSNQDSGNYRGIALSSLFLKIFDWVVLILFNSELLCDENQFGFQAESSTVMCTWAVIEVINYFNSRGTPVYACLLDYRKAFDLVNHVRMFQNLIDRQVNPVVIRLMISMYLVQQCYVRWGQARSYSFDVTNGTRQGSVFSPHGGFATYIDPLIRSLRFSGQGCSINEFWYGCFFYADDGILLATSIEGLQRMVSICESHANDNDLCFSTDPVPEKSKTKCIAFPQGYKDGMPAIILNGHDLPWVERAVHIGNTLHSSALMDQDLREKRAIFIDKCMNLNQEFHSYPPEIRLKMCRIYNTHFTGSPLWNFSSKHFSQLCNSWNVNARIMFDIPQDSHCWIVEELSECHARQMIFSRYINFIRTLANNKRPSIRALFRTVSSSVRSVTGSNIRRILLEANVPINPGVSTSSILRNHKVYTVPSSEHWKISLLKSLIEIRNSQWEIIFDNEEQSFSSTEIQLMIEDICTS